MISESQHTILETTHTRLAEIATRQQELQMLLEEATALREEQQCLEQLLAWYEFHCVMDPALAAPVPEVPDAMPPDAAALVEASLPVADPVEAELLALLDPDLPQSVRQLQAELNTRLGTTLSYSVVDNRLRRGVKHGRTRRTEEGWLRGPGAG